MSHQIRTPLNGILGYSKILLRRDDFDENQKRELETINYSGNNLLNLINEIIDISKTEARHLELRTSNFNINKLIDKISQMFYLPCREKNLRWNNNYLDKTFVFEIKTN
jgi:signal transduction histidine kinase